MVFISKLSRRRLWFAILILLIGLFAWDEWIGWRIGIVDKTPEQIAHRFGRPVLDTRQHSEGGTDELFDYCYYTWTGGRQKIHFKDGKATGSSYVGSK